MVGGRATAVWAATPGAAKPGLATLDTLVSADRGRRWHLGTTWPVLGCAGSSLMTLCAPRLVDPGTTLWWFVVRVPPGRAGNMVGFYLGALALCLAWLGIGRRLQRAPGTHPGELAGLAVVWAIPLVLGPALFSGDMFSYLAQGELLHLGLDPYHATPLALGHLGHRRLLDAVSPFWRSTTAPYGPTFLALVSVVAGASGPHLVVGILAARAVELVGVGLVAVSLPSLARSFGADPCRALWLAVASPLVLLQLVAAGHNDALMCGCMVAGVALARARHPLAGVALCALAATIKLPAGAAVLFVALSWLRSLSSGAARARFAAGALAVIAAVVGVVSGMTGLGLGWISTTLVSTPAKVHLAITPVTALGWTVARIAAALGSPISAHALESTFGAVALGATGVLALVLLWRCGGDLALAVRFLALVLLVAAFAGPAAWPWYFCWGLVLLACLPEAQRSRSLPFALVVAALLVKPDGILALPLPSAPAVLTLYGLLAWGFVRHRRAAPPRLGGAGAPVGGRPGDARGVLASS